MSMESALSDSSAAAVQEEESSQLVPIKAILSRSDKGVGLCGQNVRIGGWVRKGRVAGKGAFAFLEVNDGSCPSNLQVIVLATLYKLRDVVATGTSIHAEGRLKLPAEGSAQSIELEVENLIDVGTVCNAAKYPLPKAKLPLEFLRDFVHLRPRTSIISSIARIRNSLAHATHTFFQTHGFLYVQTPIITTIDCEGAGEMFQVTTLLSDAERLEKELKENPPPSEADLKAAELAVKEKGEAVSLLKSAKAGKDEIVAAVAELTKAKESFTKLDERCKLGERFRLGGGIPKKDGKIDYAQDFFSRQAFLTVSGQLQVESYACALGRVYSFGPTFRAENSHTSRHLAEFWMVEPEIAFADIQDNMKYAEAYVRFLCQWLLDHCYDDMEVMSDQTAIQRLEMVANSKFHRVTYTEAITILEEAAKVKKFENKVEWGIDLASEHERYLTEEKFKAPVIVYNYPKEIKAFYMKVGELIGGSQREENYEMLKERMLEMGLPLEQYQWYLDLRAYGTVKHSGFGMGFERMILFATGLDNIRDVIPFPRYPGELIFDVMIS
ncbi:hypothetical protein DH2020_022667 [Rehmannia glutinosa]|uniref:asparagine--tRNA ligase n=1 Tax=Rehmannia glutinosa TaxID=99300 RepID=A0ABR0W7L3_REHGL